MSRSVLLTAQSLLRRRKFSETVRLLEGNSEQYEQNFDYYLMLGTACLYLGDTGSANTYFSRARSIRLTDTRLLLGQAAIYLRRGETDRALQYYLDIQDYEPGNKIVAKAMDFIRTKGDYKTINRWVETGKIKQFYPPLGINPSIIQRIILLAVAFFVVWYVGGHGFTLSLPQVGGFASRYKGDRPFVDSMVPAVADADSGAGGVVDTQAGVPQMGKNSVVYSLTDKEITEAYNRARSYFSEYRDNLAQIEVNRILHSNATAYQRKQAQLVEAQLKEPTFDTPIDEITCKQVLSDPVLYNNCWVSWIGRITNWSDEQTTSFSCDLMVGDENLRHVEGIVPVVFDVAPVPAIDHEKAVRILGKIVYDGVTVTIKGKAVYQSVRGSLKIGKN